MSEAHDEQNRQRAVVVLAAFNEGAAIGPVLAGLRKRFPRIVVVDDGSTDDTAAVARRAGVTVLRHCVNRGQGAALQTGITFALQEQAEFVLTFDADGQHSVADAQLLLETLVVSDADVVLGSRFLQNKQQIPRLRRWLLRAAVLFTRLASGVPVSDAHNGLRCFTRSAAQTLDLRMDRMAHASEILDTIGRSGLRVVEAPTKISYTEYSLAKGQTNAAALRVLTEYLAGRFLQ